ncbi:Mini-ribonuclease 3 [Trichothermofontia sp.]
MPDVDDSPVEKLREQESLASTRQMLDVAPGLGIAGVTFGSGEGSVIALTRSQVQQLSPAALAYLGDAVYELYIRQYYLLSPKRIQAYHQAVVTQVRAETQTQHLHRLESHLTDAEKAIVRRGRNATGRRSRLVDPEIYQQATSLEALIGYLYLTSPQRLSDLLSLLALEPTSD